MSSAAPPSDSARPRRWIFVSFAKDHVYATAPEAGLPPVESLLDTPPPRIDFVAGVWPQIFLYLIISTSPK